MALAGAHGGARLDSAQNIRTRQRYRLGQRMAQGQLRGNGRRQRATCAMAVVRGNAR
ncbi:hypothetical protein D3C71_1416190 [compost metagenome]